MGLRSTTMAGDLGIFKTTSDTAAAGLSLRTAIAGFSTSSTSETTIFVVGGVLVEVEANRESSELILVASSSLKSESGWLGVVRVGALIVLVTVLTTSGA